MKKVYTQILLLLMSLVTAPGLRAQVLVFSEAFPGGSPTTASMCNNWTAFRASLVPLPYTKMRFTGSLSSTVFECNDPVIIADIAEKLRLLPGPSTTNAFSWIDGANTWQVGTNNGGRFGVNMSSLGSCDNPGHVMKPCYTTNANWGGFGTATCNTNPTQVMTLEFFYGTSMNNASASSIVSPVAFCAGTHNVQLKIKNSGNNLLNSVLVDWELDGVLQSQIFHSTPIDTLGSVSGNEAVINLGNVAFGTTARTIKAWTSMPNGVADTTNFDDTLLITLQPLLSGVYTIGGAGANYATFATAISDLTTVGLCGPVVFHVTSGVYNEQLTLTAIPNASATNTVTFNGNGATLQAIPVSATRALIKLDGADYVIIDSFTLISQSATYGWGVHLTNGADHNAVMNCIIDMSAVTSTTQANSAGVVVSGSATSVTTDGSANYNLISDNTIIGGYQGVIMNGDNNSLDAVGNTVSGNDILDYYANGMEFTNTDSLTVSYNKIHRPTKTTTITTSSGIEMGGGVIRSLINGNRIYDTHAATTTQSGTAYGIYSTGADAAAGFENTISNNLIYNFGSNTGTQYGIYNSSSEGTRYYHNTIVLDRQTSTSGTTRGVYLTGTLGHTVEVKNNIVHISRTGSGTKYNLYFNTATTYIVSNNNDLVMQSTSGTNGIGYYDNGGFTTLTNWQTANSNAYDQQSTDLDPIFTSTVTADFTPTNPSLDNLGVPVGVLADISGVTRSATQPDLGAYEFLNFPLSDVGIQLSAALSGKDANLRWIVKQEKQIESYTLQRSTNGSQFEDVAIIPAGRKEQYQFTDKDVVGRFTEEKLHYRIMIKEHDDRRQYSMVRTVLLKGSQYEVTVYPNPVSDKISLRVNTSVAGMATVKVYDVRGQMIILTSAVMNVGTNVVEIPSAELAKGVYQLVFEQSGETQNVPIIK